MAGKTVRVLVVDDSLVAREMLCQILASDPGIEVVGTAKDGASAVDMVAELEPDLVTMDIHMPKMDGLEATERIMAFHPTPILVVSSSVHGPGLGRAFDALSAGALEVLKKPEPQDWAQLEHIGREIIRKVKMLANVKVITHVRGKRASEHAAAKPARVVGRDGHTLVAIGSSTGGPSALAKVLAPLPRDFPAPIAIAQHIADGFVSGLASWLDGLCHVHVKIAEPDELMLPGVAYISTTGANLEVEDLTCRRVPTWKGQLYIPSADILFASVARQHGRQAVGVILTGMGNDGAVGLKEMRDAGALTIAQDEATSVVYGMPKAAFELGAAVQVLPVDSIAAALSSAFSGA